MSKFIKLYAKIYALYCMYLNKNIHLLQNDLNSFIKANIYIFSINLKLKFFFFIEYDFSHLVN